MKKKAIKKTVEKANRKAGKVKVVKKAVARPVCSVTLNLNGQSFIGKGDSVTDCLNQIATENYTKIVKTKADFTAVKGDKKTHKVIFNRLLIKRFFNRATFREFFAKRLTSGLND